MAKAAKFFATPDVEGAKQNYAPKTGGGKKQTRVEKNFATKTTKIF